MVPRIPLALVVILLALPPAAAFENWQRVHCVAGHEFHCDAKVFIAFVASQLAFNVTLAGHGQNGTSIALPFNGTATAFVTVEQVASNASHTTEVEVVVDATPGVLWTGATQATANLTGNASVVLAFPFRTPPLWLPGDYVFPGFRLLAEGESAQTWRTLRIGDPPTTKVDPPDRVPWGPLALAALAAAALLARRRARDGNR